MKEGNPPMLLLPPDQKRYSSVLVLFNLSVCCLLLLRWILCKVKYHVSLFSYFIKTLQ